MRARVAQDGTATVLEEATIEGAAISARADGRIDLAGATPTIALNVEGGVLDIDRYLPPPAPSAEAAAAQPAQTSANGGANLLAALSDEPIDLSTLRQLEGGVRVQLGGIRARGYEVGTIALAMTASGGGVTTELSDLALYGGTVRGSLQIDAADSVPAVEAGLIVDTVSVDDILAVTGGTDLPRLGLASILLATTRAAPVRATWSEAWRASSTWTWWMARCCRRSRRD